MSSPRTRSNSSCHLSNLVGPGMQLLVSELPTVRDLLRLGLLKRKDSDADRRNCLFKDLVNDIYTDVLAQWQKANAQFTVPVIVSERGIKRKMENLWARAVEVCLGKGEVEVKQTFIQGLDRLFDILSCKCQIRSCAEVGCSPDCAREAHTAAGR
ncbi:hypothetical protein Hamer_G003017 [Homarus americanus]|uniref:Uncharacterized protein n=1 Tax=Homarus americanus TaxID=6706 RepID=A0A8J5JYM9_HOMAM|nr:hypothetical protein Hamer_G003017 [Homarus americanus]